jgi:hypothetical protein
MQIPIENTLAEIKEAWRLLFGGIPAPPDNQLVAWILRHGSDAVKQSVIRAARKYERLNKQASAGDMEKYITAIISK